MADDKQVQAKTEQKVEIVAKANPMLSVTSKDMPTKWEFAHDKSKDKPEGE